VTNIWIQTQVFSMIHKYVFTSLSRKWRFPAPVINIDKKYIVFCN